MTFTLKYPMKRIYVHKCSINLRNKKEFKRRHIRQSIVHLKLLASITYKVLNRRRNWFKSYFLCNTLAYLKNYILSVYMNWSTHFRDFGLCILIICVKCLPDYQTIHFPNKLHAVVLHGYFTWTCIYRDASFPFISLTLLMMALQCYKVSCPY